jgi:hypothetical protein
LERAAKELKSSLDAPYRPFTERHVWPLSLALSALLLAAIIARAWEQVSTPDGPLYRATLLTIESLLVMTLLLTCWHIITLWRLLHCFLTALEPLPFVTAFTHPDRTGSRRPIWVRWLNLESLDVFYRTGVILHDLALRGVPLEVDLPKYKEHLQDLLNPYKSRHHHLNSARHLREISCLIAAEVFNTMSAMTGPWRTEPLLHAATPVDSAREKEGSPSINDHPFYIIQGDPTEGRNLGHALLALHYTPYLLYVVRQIQNLIWYLPVGFVLLTFSLTSYCVQSPQFVSHFLLLLFVLIGLVLWHTMSGMERDMILSRVAGTNEGQLNKEFFFKFLGYGALPALSLIASQFPSISNFLYSWVEPTVKALH